LIHHHVAWPCRAGRRKKPIYMKQQTINSEITARRKGVRRTLVVTVSIALAFFLVSFLQILLMK
jgi:hypothetical protein